jgi:hypothetical protein
MSVSLHFRCVAGVAICVACLAPKSAAGPSDTPENILQRTRAMYAALRTYADSGVVLREYGTGSSKDRHTFTTSFNRVPRRFVLDFRKQGGDRFVIWGDPDAFHTWWQTTGVQSDYPNPNNLPAINQTGYTTVGSSTKIPGLLYGKAALEGLFSNFADPALEGTDEISGRRCYRLVGRSSDFYKTGHEVNIHKLTVWIDVESLLIRRAQEEWKALPGTISRTTTTFEPQANSVLDDKRLQFVPPAPK